jgi:hypothetical protein
MFTKEEYAVGSVVGGCIVAVVAAVLWLVGVLPFGPGALIAALGLLHIAVPGLLLEWERHRRRS